MDFQLPDALPFTGRSVTFDNVVFPTAVEELFRYGAGWRRTIAMGDTGQPVMWFELHRGEFTLEIKTDGWMLSQGTRQVEQGEAETFADVFAAGMAALNRNLFGEPPKAA